MSPDRAMQVLLIGLVIGLFALQPAADLDLVPTWLPVVLTITTLMAGALALSRPTPLRWPIILGAGAGVGGYLVQIELLYGLGSIIGLAALALALLRQVLAHGPVNRYRIAGAIALYLVMSLGFANFYELLDALLPGSFSGAKDAPHSFRYFSIVVQTTIGFGDILPVTPLARSFVMLQAVSGQFFIAVLLARLMALHAGSGRPGG